MTENKGKPIEIADPFARRLVGRYLSHRKNDISKLQSALAESDFETIRVTGHNLFGSGSAYGLDEISYMGAGIEKAADDQDVVRIECLIDDLIRFLRKLHVY